MSRVEAAASMDRLPWLPDEPKPLPAKRRAPMATWALAAVVLVAAGGSWVAWRNVERPGPTPVRGPHAVTTVQLPQPRPAPPEVRMPAQPQVRLIPTLQVRPTPTREVKIAAPPAVPRKAERMASSAAKKPRPAAAAKRSTAVAPPAPVSPPQYLIPKPWDPRVVTGAAGRLVQVGAFGSVHQAKRGWWFMVHDYPAMAHLPAVVRETRNSKGRSFYRFDVGTTSQAHSEVLCQRMRTVHLSCAVVGLPWKAKVER